MCFVCSIVNDSIIEVKVSEITQGIYMLISLLAFVGALLFYSLAAICFYSKKIGFKFIFNKEYLIFAGGIYPNISREKIYYSEFSKVYLDVEYTLFLYTGSERILAEISLNTGKDKIKQILLEFQKRGKSVKTASELYGLYSVDEGCSNGN